MFASRRRRVSPSIGRRRKRGSIRRSRVNLLIVALTILVVVGSTFIFCTIHERKTTAGSGGGQPDQHHHHNNNNNRFHDYFNNNNNNNNKKNAYRVFSPKIDWDNGKEPRGSYVFQSTKPCATAAATFNATLCQIHFPSDALEQSLPCDMTMTNDDKKYNMYGSRSLKLCLRTRQGFKPRQSSTNNDEDDQQQQKKANIVPNQDRSLLLQPLTISTPMSITQKGERRHGIALESDCMLLLLTDGHGPYGHLTTMAVQRDLPFRILHLLEKAAIATVAENSNDIVSPSHDSNSGTSPTSSEDGTTSTTTTSWDIPSLLKQAFLDCDKEVAMMAGRNSGATAIVVLKIASMIYLASVGDSTALLAQWTTTTTTGKKDNDNKNQNYNDFGFVKILATVPFHKPHVRMERRRIEKLGGHVILPHQFSNKGDSSRVLIPTISDSGKRSTMALAMSRTLGDREGKTPGWLIAEPTILTVSLSEEDNNDKSNSTNNNNPDLHQLFVLVASDGVIDHHPLSQVLPKAANALFSGKDNISTNSNQSKVPGLLGKAVDSILQTSARH